MKTYLKEKSENVLLRTISPVAEIVNWSVDKA